MTEETVQVESTETAVQMNAQMGLRLRGAREKANMSLREMARRVHLSPSFISQVELGRTAPSVGTLYAMVTELGLSLDSLMAEDVAPHDLETPAPVPSARPTLTDRTEVAHANGSSRTSSVQPLPEVGALPGLQRADERPELYLGGVRWERLTPDDDRSGRGVPPSHLPCRDRILPRGQPDEPRRQGIHPYPVRTLGDSGRLRSPGARPGRQSPLRLVHSAPVEQPTRRDLRRNLVRGRPTEVMRSHTAV